MNVSLIRKHFVMNGVTPALMNAKHRMMRLGNAQILTSKKMIHLDETTLHSGIA